MKKIDIKKQYLEGDEYYSNKTDKKTIVLPETTDIRIIKAAAAANQKDIANIVLVGFKKQITEDANSNGLDISKSRIIEISEFEELAEYIEKIVELRKHRGMTIEKATEWIKNPLVFGMMLVKMGVADGMVAGAINATANVLGPAVRLIKTAPGTKIISSFFPNFYEI